MSRFYALLCTCKISTRNQNVTQHEKNLTTEMTDYTISNRNMNVEKKGS